MKDEAYKNEGDSETAADIAADDKSASNIGSNKEPKVA